MADLSALWGDTFLADYELALVPAGGGGGDAMMTSDSSGTSSSSSGACAAGGSRGCCACAAAGSGDDAFNGEALGPAVFPVHAAVLAGQSPYFRALLSTWTDPRDRRISVPVACAAERAAAEMALRAAYGGGAPPGADAGQLLACMVVADRYQLRGVAAACAAAIRALGPRDLPWRAALALLRLPPGLAEADAFGGLAERAHARVLADFGDLDMALQRPELRAAFLELPRAAVARLVTGDDLRCVSENAVFLAVASWLRARVREAADAAAAAAANGGCGGSAASSGGGDATAEAAADALALLRLVRYPQMTANFLAAVAAHEQLLRLHPDFSAFLLEAAQHALASPEQRAALAAAPGAPRRLKPRAPRGGGGGAGGACGGGGASAFTSHIARADLCAAVTKYRASGGRDAYYLLTEGHVWNGFTWRLKLTVKPPEPCAAAAAAAAGNAAAAGGATGPCDMNVHVGLCWSVEPAGDALPLADAAVAAVDFAIATHDAATGDEDATASGGPVLIRAGTCWGWDDFFGREAYADLDAEWVKWIDADGRLPLTCHLYSCA